MAAAPLTHHEILSLVEPFTRAGLQVDLAATDRAQRKLAFKPVLRAPTAGGPEPAATGAEPVNKPADRVHEAPAAAAAATPLADGEGPGPVTLTETLLLHCHDAQRFTLTRTLAHPAGLQATLQAGGASPAVLLAQVQALPLALQFSHGRGYALARSYELTSSPHPPPPGRSTADQRLLLNAQVQLSGLTLNMNLLQVRGVAADLALHPAAGEPLDLPEDLLAVLGWDWARLVPGQDGWTSKLRLRGQPLRRSTTAERGLTLAAQHLAQVLAEPPLRFHQRHRGARWWAMLRRSIPTLTAVALILVAVLLPRITDAEMSGVWMALHYVPIGLLALSFSLQELSRFEIPYWPRKPRGDSWRRNGGASGDLPSPGLGATR